MSRLKIVWGLANLASLRDRPLIGTRDQKELLLQEEGDDDDQVLQMDKAEEMDLLA